MRDKIHGLKANARAIILMSRWQPVIIGAVYALIVTVLMNIAYYVSGYVDMLNDYMQAIKEGAEQIAIVIPSLSIVDILIMAAMLILIKLIAAGFNISMLMLSRGRVAKVRDLFDGFSSFFKTLAVCIIRDALITAGLFLLVLPGLWLKYRYRFAIEAMFDDDTLGPIGALRRSATLTNGHKWELFVLDFSFIIWRLVGTFVSLLFSFSVFDAWITPYIGLAFAVDYNLLSDWQPSEEDNFDGAQSPEDALNALNERYIIWKKVEDDKNDEPVSPDSAASQPVEVPTPESETVSVMADEPVDEPETNNKEPDIAYWKERAMRIQQEIQQKNMDNK